MADTADNGGDAGPPTLPGSNIVAGFVGAAVGGVGTLVSKLGVEKLLSNNAYIGIAVFALLAAVLIMIVALPLRTSARVQQTVKTFAILLVGVAVVFGAADWASGAQKIEIVLRAMPKLKGAPTIQIAGAERAALAWGSDLSYRVGRKETVTLDLESLSDYYDQQKVDGRKACIEELRTMCTPALGTGPG